MNRKILPLALAALALTASAPAASGADAARFTDQIAPLLKTHCVKCHGPAKAEGGLNLSRGAGVARGGKHGPVVAAHDLDGSPLWDRVDADEMPPKTPLPPAEKEILKRWILDGAPGLPRSAATEGEHWAFQPLAPVAVPADPKSGRRARNSVDRFVQAKLDERNLRPGPEADPVRLARRVSLTLTGLPPAPEAVDAFLADRSPDAYARLVDKYLSDDGFGHRWGKFWLDAAGYADSNGYFQADTDRPFAYRYRDYVIRSVNRDVPFDRFVREQIAGDEIADHKPGDPATPESFERLVATHYLRNGQDGSGESDGNPDEVRVDRYTALESCQQIVASSLLGLTMQCAKCHSHKFEPIPQEDYYRLQAIFDPIFPAATTSLWIKPQARLLSAPSVAEKSAWETRVKDLEATEARLRKEKLDAVRVRRPRGRILFEDGFDSAGPLAARWSNTAPGDDAPGGKPPVTLDSDVPPAGRIRKGRLEIVAGGTNDSWLVTKEAFDWTPKDDGGVVQVTFDLVDDRLTPDGTPAERMGYFIAAVDFDDDGKTPGGNVLIDGHPSQGSSVHLDYPGKDAEGKKAIGRTGYKPGRNYGVRVTNAGKGKFRLEHLVDGLPEEETLVLTRSDLPRGAFGFEYHAGRAFVVDNVRVESFPPAPDPAGVALKEFAASIKSMSEAHEAAHKELEKAKGAVPGQVAWASDVTPNPPATRLLARGNYGSPAAAVEPGPPSALVDKELPYVVKRPPSGRTTGRRLAFAIWLTDPKSRGAALMARVEVNRIWQAVFGTGIVATSENLGLSGAEPSNPELLDHLAREFVASGWSRKHVLRLMLNSAAFRRSSDAPGDDLSLARFPVQRLEAESIRDAMLAVSGDLDGRRGGPAVRLDSGDGGAVVVAEGSEGSNRRSIYLTSKRTRVVSLLQVFDAPSIVYNSLRRPRTTMPLQALAMLNSEFVRARATSFAARIERGAADPAKRIELAFRLAYGRAPAPAETAAAAGFVAAQTARHGGGAEGAGKARIDFCHALLVGNEFIYID